MVPASKCSVTNLLNTFLLGTKWISLEKKQLPWWRAMTWLQEWFLTLNTLSQPQENTRNIWQLLPRNSFRVTVLPKLYTLNLPALLQSRVGTQLPNSLPTNQDWGQSPKVIRTQGPKCLYVPNPFFLVSKCEAQQSSPPCQLLDHLCQEFFNNALQKPPGLSVSCWVALPADNGVIQVPQEDQSLRTAVCFQLSEEGLAYFFFLTRQPMADLHNRTACAGCSSWCKTLPGSSPAPCRAQRVPAAALTPSLTLYHPLRASVIPRRLQTSLPEVRVSPHHAILPAILYLSVKVIITAIK